MQARFIAVLSGLLLFGCASGKNDKNEAIGGESTSPPRDGDGDAGSGGQAPQGPAIAAPAEASAGQSEWAREPLALDSTEPFGTAARALIDELAGSYTGVWPASSGLGALQLELSYEGAALSLDRRTAIVANPPDVNGDGIADGSVRIAAPMKLKLTSASSDLVLRWDSAPMLIGEAHAGWLGAVIVFSALEPPFDTARVADPAAASCDQGRLEITLKDGQLERVSLSFQGRTSGALCGTVRAAELRRGG